MRAKKTVEKFGDGPRDDKQDDYENPDEPESEIECLISWYVRHDWSVYARYEECTNRKSVSTADSLRKNSEMHHKFL